MTTTHSNSQSTRPTDRLTDAARADDPDTISLIAYITAGFPTLEGFADALAEVRGAADVVEVGVPFSDPMADGATIQLASHTALHNGTTLGWILKAVRKSPDEGAPIVLMSYLNPLLRYGLNRFAADAAQAGVCGVIVPDLPCEESAILRVPLHRCGLALVPMVSPTTPPERAARIAAEGSGFVYAVTVAGTTGGAITDIHSATEYLRTIRDQSDLPVCAGFGIRTAEQVRALVGVVDGAVIGSALVEAMGNGRSPGSLLNALRQKKNPKHAARTD